MIHSTVLAGSVALLAVMDVNAGPCHPSPSVTTTAAATSVVAKETLALAFSAAETASTADATDSETLTTTTEVETTTTEAKPTAAATTTSAAPEEPENKYNGLSSPYTAAGGASFELLCGQVGSVARPLGSDLQISSYQECLDACSQVSNCWGVNFHNSQFACTMWSQVFGFYDNAEYSTSKRSFTQRF